MKLLKLFYNPKKFKNKPEEYWTKQGEKKSLELFHNMAVHVPAYKDFLKKNKIDHTKIKTRSDWDKIPNIDKNNYLRVYSKKDLCWQGTLKSPLVWTSTSGSTGERIYFPRNKILDEQYSVILSDFLKNNPNTLKGSTLVVVGFGMGVWIGGLITYQAFAISAQDNNFPISVITPGINKLEIFKILKDLSPDFDQTILVGYAPFIKDIVDDASNYDIDFKKINLRLLFAAEVVNEGMRDYLAEKSNMENVYTDTMNVYGSADIGAMAFETGISILIKRLALKNKPIYDELFLQSIKVPTLAQFNPMFTNFENQEEDIVLSGNNALPLLKYSIGDCGRVLGYNEVISLFFKYNIDLKKEAKICGINNIKEFPFVYIYERKDFSTTIYGLQVYPDMIRPVFWDKNFSDLLSGKFTLITKFDENHNQYIEINCEMREKGENTVGLKDLLLGEIKKHLLEKSSEFKELTNHYKDKEFFKVILWPQEDPLYFKPGVKQKWVKK